MTKTNGYVTPGHVSEGVDDGSGQNAQATKQVMARAMMPARVRALDATLANQIAAGEVVERPASVLKELLENALDAQATRIEVHAERGGITSLRVTDDGAGIHHEDLHLALERHATSKIATLEQLESVVSMGFRGEALPSIASVSKMQVTSRTRAEHSAWQISCEGGLTQGSPTPASHPPGTSVLVRELFYNTPVRRRFLRTPRTEFRHLERAFKRIALAASTVAMSFHHDGKELLRVAAAHNDEAQRRRIGRLLGESFAARALSVRHEAAGMGLFGWIGDVDASRERNDRQHLFVNGRAVTDTTVRHAVRLAYGSAIADTQHPSWLLYLHVDPREVDVNVHPAKHEVRFRESRMVHDFVRASVRDVLEVAANQSSTVGAKSITATGTKTQIKTDTKAGVKTSEVPRAYELDVNDAALRDRNRPSATAARKPASLVTTPAIKVLAMLEDGLLVARRGDQFLLARCGDLLSALARITLSEIAQGVRDPISRPLLLPERLSTRGSVLDDEYTVQLLESFGFGVRPSAEQSVLLLAVPECLSAVRVQSWSTVFTREYSGFEPLTGIAIDSSVGADAAGAIDKEFDDVVDKTPARQASAQWIARFGRLAAEQSLHDIDAVAAILAQLAHIEDDTAPWVMLDAQRSDAVFSALARR